MDIAPDRVWLTQQLRNCLENLASPGFIALSQVPEDSHKADEMALEFDNFYQAYIQNFGHELSEQQRSELALVDDLLSTMSESPDSQLWTDESVRSDPAWQRVRSASASALNTLGWAVA